jgi:predicted acylesterase/phospholipase RssA
MKIRIKTPDGRYLAGDLVSRFPVRLLTAGSDSGQIGEFWITDTHIWRSPLLLAGNSTILIQNSTTREQAELLDPYLTNFGIEGFTNRIIQISTDASSGRSDRFRGFFRIVKISGGSSSIRHGDRVAFQCVDNPDRPFPASGAGRGWWSVVGNEIHLTSRTTPGESETFVVEIFKDLKLYWNNRLSDNYSTADGAGENTARINGYNFIRVQGQVYIGPAPGLEPLKMFWHESRGDAYLTATEEGASDAIIAGYTFRGIQGYVPRGSKHGTVPLKVYWNAARQDHFTAVAIKEEQDAADAGYQFVRIEGHIFPSFEAATSVTTTPPLTRPTGPLDNPIGGPTGGGSGQSGGLLIVRSRRQAKKRALVLSGGGAKGCFQAGAVQYLLNHFQPDIICGVSVGALNAAKLAEGRGAAGRLLDIWREINAPTGDARVFQKDFFIDMMEKWIRSQVDDADDLLNLGSLGNKILYAATHLHAIHSMAPLRRLIQRHLNPAAIRASGMDLRVGLINMETSQFFSVAQPQFDGDLAGYGRIEVEPDHQMGESWLTRPVYGASSYLMNFENAIYASCTLPVFMDPLISNLRLCRHRNVDGERLAVLPLTQHPPALQRIFDLFERNANPTGQQINDALKKFLSDEPEYGFNQLRRESDDPFNGDARSYQQHLFDGGLRDTLPIRTAMRLGAREIIVITGDQLQRSEWNFSNPNLVHPKPDETSLSKIPAIQYFLGLLSTWYNESARSDMMLAVAQNEFLGWMYRCFSLIPSDKRQQLINEFNQYYQSHGRDMRRAMGGSSWLGGSSGFQVSAEGPGYAPTKTELQSSPYGVPFHDEGCKISFIAPDRELLGPLDFTDRDGIEMGIALGRLAAESPVELSFPVPESAIGTESVR